MSSSIEHMQLTDQDIREFQQAWREDFNEEISVERARKEASLLLELYFMIYRKDVDQPEEQHPHLNP